MTEEEQKAEVLGEVSAMIREIVGEDWVRDTPIKMETSFSRDLELESIELVALSEKIQERYGTEIDFPAWLAAMELDDIINLSVGDLVLFITSWQSKS